MPSHKPPSAACLQVRIPPPPPQHLTQRPLIPPAAGAGAAVFDDAAGARCDALAEVAFEGLCAWVCVCARVRRLMRPLGAGLLLRASVEGIVNVRWHAGSITTTTTTTTTTNPPPSMPTVHRSSVPPLPPSPSLHLRLHFLRGSQTSRVFQMCTPYPHSFTGKM